MRFYILFALACITNNVGATHIELMYSSWVSNTDQKHINTWVSHSIEATEKTLGALQQTKLNITVEPVFLASEPVPWGAIKRGEYDSVELHVKRFTSSEVLLKDWTIYHEVAHLYHPLLDYPDFWLAEGLATYLQNIIMLDNAVFDIDEFNLRLRSGLKRGRDNTKAAPGTLSSVSENMWSLNAQQRVYWSGVAFFIEADLALSTKGKSESVRTLIAQFQRCCKMTHPSGQRHSAQLFIAHLDRLSKTTIFSNLYASYKLRRDFPIISSSQLNALQPLR
ncbi:hypothetical protein J8Z24_09070 [Pseudoalteromonas sp. SCSIO 43201]|uniref:hypothetical protein n=1 Tax=Pseudoalteromonas TaxID=53246 RepID=UPI0020759D48|nr:MULTISPECIES: hypothetical protein [Pseudoalteromonas]MDW7548308.1 hypothetical protein [Pseudoalteromonas peptidolytica]USD27143.1 hypothetical protein J8Z24_09070 [Pseudoalteromonas sp. SCSIO 43201]